jgi:hypothetical protein
MKRLLTFATFLFILSYKIHAAALSWEKTEMEVHPATTEPNAVAVFKYENKSDKPVHIASVRTSCGCTTAALMKNDVAPGEKGEITATMSLGGSSGIKQKTITVTTDDATQPVTVLTLRAVITQPFELQPAFVFWKVGEAPQPKTILAKVSKDAKISSVDVGSSNNDFTAKVTPSKDGDYQIEVLPKDTSRTSASTSPLSR